MRTCRNDIPPAIPEPGKKNWTARNDRGEEISGLPAIIEQPDTGRRKRAMRASVQKKHYPKKPRPGSTKGKMVGKREAVPKRESATKGGKKKGAYRHKS